MPINVLLVDDSAIIRGLLTKALSSDPDIAITGSAANGKMAIDMAGSLQPNIIILDIEMPVMDGITALPEILKVSPKSKVIIASTLSVRNAEISLKALALGATDYLAKPSTKSGTDLESFYYELRQKIHVLATGKSAPLKGTPAATVVPAPTPAGSSAPIVTVTPGGALNPQGTKALAIASSTGGPQALLTLFAQLKGTLKNIPIFITQHMPPTFTTILAEQIAKGGSRPCSEGKEGLAVQAGEAYLAPGDFHMLAEKNADGLVALRINKDPQENFCRPAADPMLRSLSKIYGANLAVLVLTGMGQDGMEGCKIVVQNGGSVIAQNEATCVVYGMPKAVAENNLCKAVLPLPEIGAYLAAQIDGRKP